MIYSHSRLSTHATCPKQFGLVYVDERPRAGADYFDFGSLVHEALEFMLGECKSTGYVGTLPVDRVRLAFSYLWARSGVRGFRPFADAEDSLVMWAKRRGRVDGRRVVAVEAPFQIKVDGHDVQGVIDLVDVDEYGAVRVIDYKTSKRMPTQADVDDSLQLSIYALAMRQRFPGRRIRVALDMLRHDAVVWSERTDAQLDQAERYIGALIERIEADTEFKARPSILCGWCGVRQYCDTYASMMVGDGMVDEVPVAPDRLLHARQLAHVVEGLARKRKRDLDDAIKARLDVTNGDLEHDGLRARLIDTRTLIYDVERTRAAAAEHGVDVAPALSVDKRKLKDLLKRVRAEDESRAILAEVEIKAAATERKGQRIDVREDKSRTKPKPSLDPTNP